jgi:hypothetical protein
MGKRGGGAPKSELAKTTIFEQYIAAMSHAMDFREAGEPVSHSLNPTREGVMLNSKSCFLIAPAKWLV